MPFTAITLGTPNQGDGDSLRDGGQKINDNFDSAVTLDTAQTITGAKSFSANVGVGITSPAGGVTSNIGTWRFEGQAPNTDAGFARHVAGGNVQWQAFGNGNTENTNNSYGAISDIKLKENIVNATPKLDKLNQIRVVNYNLKHQPEQKLLGVIAQELADVFPGLIDEHPDRDEEGNDLGTTTKSVKYSVFVPMLIKAVQELSAKVEALEGQLEVNHGV